VEHKRTLNFYFRISVARSRFALSIVRIIFLHWEMRFHYPPSVFFHFYWSFPGRLAAGDRPVTLINAHRFIKYALAVWKIIFYAHPAAICPRRSPQRSNSVCVCVCVCVCVWACICVSGKSCNLMRQFFAARWSIHTPIDRWKILR